MAYKTPIALKDKETFAHSDNIKTWLDDTRLCLQVVYVCNYLVESEAVDSKIMNCYNTVRPGRLATPNLRNWSQLKGRWRES